MALLEYRWHTDGIPLAHRWKPQMNPRRHKKKKLFAKHPPVVPFATPPHLPPSAPALAAPAPDHLLAHSAGRPSAIARPPQSPAATPRGSSLERTARVPRD